MRGTWRNLPTAMEPYERELTEALRAMKDGCGLTLVELAGKTHFSKSSWHRWLNGDRLVTEEAMLRLCELAGCPPGRSARLAVLRSAAQEQAAAAQAGGEIPEAPDQAKVGPGRTPVRRPHVGTVLAAGVCFLAGVGLARAVRSPGAGRGRPPGSG